MTQDAVGYGPTTATDTTQIPPLATETTSAHARTDTNDRTEPDASTSEQAAEVASHAKESGAAVAQTAADQAKSVAEEAKRQTRNLLGEAQGQVREQAGTQQERVKNGLRSLADELHSMADNGEQSGLATELAHQASQRAHGAADWLDGREPGDLLDEVRTFARRRPGAFLLGSLVAGVLAGRLTRGAVAAASDDDDRDQNTTRATPSPTDTSTGVGPSSGYGDVAYPAVASYPADPYGTAAAAPQTYTEPAPYATPDPYAATDAYSSGAGSHSPADPSQLGEGRS